MDEQLLRANSTSGGGMTASQQQQFRRNRSLAQERLERLYAQKRQLRDDVNEEPNSGRQVAVSAAQRELISVQRRIAALETLPPAEQARLRPELERERNAAQQRLNREISDLRSAQTNRIADPSDRAARQSLVTQLQGAQRELASYDRMIAELNRTGEVDAPANIQNGRVATLQRNIARYEQQLSDMRRQQQAGQAVSSREQQQIERSLRQAQLDLRKLEQQANGNSRNLNNSPSRRVELERGRERAQQRITLLQRQIEQFDRNNRQ